MLNPGDVVWVAPKDLDQPTGVWSLMQIPEIGGGLVALDPHTGPRACRGRRLLVLAKPVRPRPAGQAPAGLVLQAVRLRGRARQRLQADQHRARCARSRSSRAPGKEVWTPKNYDGTKSYGPSTLRVGIEKSRNQMTVRLAQDMGMPMIVEYSKRFGVYDDLLPVLAMSLGSGETTLVKLAAGLLDVRQRRQAGEAHADRPHPGPLGQDHLALRRPRVPRTAMPRAGRARPSPRCPTDDRKQIIDPHTAYQITSMMEGVIQRGTGTIIRQNPSQRADGRQDRHHQRREGRLVRRLHARPRGRRVHRLRHAAPDGQRHDRRPRRGPHLRALHEGGAGGQASRAVPTYRLGSNWCA